MGEREYDCSDVEYALTPKTWISTEELEELRANRDAWEKAAREYQVSCGEAHAEVTRQAAAHQQTTGDLLGCRKMYDEAVVRVTRLREAVEALLEWHAYESDPAGFAKEHNGWVPLLPWQRARVVLEETKP